MTSAPVFAGTLRLAGAADAERVAALHARSWRVTYRGACSDAYLDGGIEEERLGVWRARFADPRPGQVVVVADEAGSLAGFACAFAEHDPMLGSLVDNLHVDPARKRGGLGRSLMRDVARRLGVIAPSRPVYLHALDTNRDAQRFYARLGGVVVARGDDVLADGSPCATVTFAWSLPAAMAAATEA